GREAGKSRQRARCSQRRRWRSRASQAWGMRPATTAFASPPSPWTWARNAVPSSPAGQSVALIRPVGERMQICIRTLDATDSTPLVETTRGLLRDFWSPDSRRIFYVYLRDLWSVGASGGTPIKVLSNAGYNVAITPDGKSLVGLAAASNG